jgi:hypothetical protein
MNKPEDILLLAKSVDVFAPQTIHTSYRVFIQYFRQPLSEDGILAGAYMVYGWMPTMLRLKGPVDAVFKLVEAGRTGRVTEALLTDCSKTLNNSLVGTTKLLHFVSPDLYPIWDSRVYRALFSKAPHRYRVEDPVTYFSFLSWLYEFESLSGFPHIKDAFESEAGYPVTNKRVAEAILYSLGGKPKIPALASLGNKP